ncbi:hypothetical protein HPB52_002423 [Rhipicephalus sanguineus]|uniref:CCHC-type domain-containing protein n=1 Tax=Rhipicephalus sanguineus TaxID=34632 RepID=A0A9D4PUV0_RHISA|nr:hypothetical protein HPB52_002423 [Rhipicephalus sanguineus]
MFKSASKRSAKRMADSQMDADGFSSETPASKRECLSPAASASPGFESKYKVVVKPPDVDSPTELRTLPATAGSTVQVQAYLSSGSDLRRYVVSGVDPGESRESLVDALTCSTHKVVTDRYMGRGCTCLVALQGPRMPPSRITYYGCILQFHVYKPGVVHCYRCFRTGHMRASCPQSTDASMESAETPTYKCGLCQTDDHDVTSKDCPVKQKAIKALRQRRRRERSATQEERDADIPTSNRFELLYPSEEDALALEQPDNTYLGGAAYSTVLKRGKRRAQQATSTPELTDTTADDLVKLDQQIAQLQMEVKHLTQRRAVLARPAGPTTTRGKDAPCAAFVPEPPCTSASPQAKLIPAEDLPIKWESFAIALRWGSSPLGSCSYRKRTRFRAFPDSLGMLLQPSLIDAAPMRWDLQARLQCMSRLHILRRKFPCCRGVTSGKKWWQCSLDSRALT